MKLEKIIDYFVLFVSFVILFFTRFYEIDDLPGLHFDEAWQLEAAHRIQIGHGSWQGMNDYTLAIVPKLLSFVLDWGDGSWISTRYFLGSLGIVGILGIARLISLYFGVSVAAIFLLIHSILPLSVHQFRFFIEMTHFHTFCLAGFLWGLQISRFWIGSEKLKSRFDTLSAWIGVLIATLFFTVGASSHILFFILVPSLQIWIAYHRSKDTHTLKTLMILLWSLTGILSLRMAIGIQSRLPWVLTFGSFSIAILWSLLKANTWKPIHRITETSFKLFPWVSLPFLIAYIGLFLAGPWNYAQVTGKLQLIYGIPNLILIWLVAGIWYKNRQNPELKNLSVLFFSLFLFCSLIILKQSPRYTTLPTHAAILVLAYILSKISWISIRYSIISLFTVYNLSLFYTLYAKPYQEFGSVDQTYSAKLLRTFKDNARDFRPIHRVLEYLDSQNCRIQFQDNYPPMKYMSDRIYAPITAWTHTKNHSNPIPNDKKCPWDESRLNIAHRSAFQNVIHYDLSWGDLAVGM